jgi:hypothetical protein
MSFENNTGIWLNIKEKSISVKIDNDYYSAPKILFDDLVNGVRSGLNLSIKTDDGFEKTELWLNKSKSGKAITLRYNNEFYIIAVSQVAKKDSLQFAKIIND